MGLALGPAAGRPRRVGKKKAKGAILETNGGNGDGREGGRDRERERGGEKRGKQAADVSAGCFKVQPHLFFLFLRAVVFLSISFTSNRPHTPPPLSFPLCPSLLSIVSNTPRRIDSSSRASRSNRSMPRTIPILFLRRPLDRVGVSMAGDCLMAQLRGASILLIAVPCTGCIRFERRNSSRRMRRRRACLAFNKEVSSVECRQDRGRGYTRVRAGNRIFGFNPAASPRIG